MRIVFATLPEEIRAYFRLFQRSVVDTLTAKLQIVFGQSFGFADKEYFLSSSETAYEDDGNTQCSGTSYRGFWTVPLYRQSFDIQEEYWNYYHGSGQCALYFPCEIKVRNRDLKSQYSSSEIVVAGFSTDGRKCQDRIALSTSGILRVQRATVFEAAKRIIQIQQDTKLWESIPHFE